MIYVNTTLLVELLMYGIVYLVLMSADSVNCFKNWQVLEEPAKAKAKARILSMIIKQIFTEPETEVKWYFDRRNCELATSCVCFTDCSMVSFLVFPLTF